MTAERVTLFGRSHQQIVLDVDRGTLSGADCNAIESAAEIIGLVILHRVVIFKDAVVPLSGFKSKHKTVIGPSIMMAVFVNGTI